MQIEFVGAARTVTGSKHLVRTRHATVLLDCGLFQGRRRDALRVNQELGVDARKIDAVVLSHAHIDHSGALPLLAKHGYEGAIYATPATRDLAAVMLEDSALIQQQDARYVNRSIERDGIDMEPVEPLYGPADVVRVLEHLVSVPYRRKTPIADGVWLTFFDAGHVLGSAVCVLDVDDEGETKRVVFTGDLGRKNAPILKDPEVVSGAHVLLTESTYGNRLHKPIEAMEEELGALVTRVAKRGGKVIVPTFALERAQEILFTLKKLRLRGELGGIPVFVDSPLTVKVTDVFKLHPECYDAETRALIQADQSPFDFDDLRYVSDKEESKRLDSMDGPAVILSASGMCEAGRVLHHLKATLESDRNAICIVGFQAQHTLGRRIVERRPRVKIFGVERDLRAEVAVLAGFSAHADQADLLEYAEATRERGPLRKVLLVHGEDEAQAALLEKLGDARFPDVAAPAAGDVVEL